MYFGTISNSEIKSDGTHDGIIIYYIPYINGEEIILTITNNNIFNFKTAIKLITPGDPMFKYEENWIGIHNNNIYNNTDYNIMNEYYTDIDATNNYWGTADEEEIQEKIYDYLDNDELRTVIYDPYMTSPIQF